MNSNLLIFGAGQYGAVVKEIAESMNQFDMISFLDDKNPVAVGKICEYEKLTEKYRYAFIAIGNPDVRAELLQKLKTAGYTLATLISPRACVSPLATVGCGSVIEPMAVVQANATVGEGCLVCAGAVIKHNAVLENICYIDCGAVVMPCTTVPCKFKVEANSVYRKQ